jgi:hypothetical protein
MEFSFHFFFFLFSGLFVLKGGSSVCAWHESVDLGCEVNLLCQQLACCTVFTLLETFAV